MKKISFFIILLIFSLFSSFSASVNVDELKIIADGHFDSLENKFNMNTYFKFKTSFDGGYKFAANVTFETNITELEKNYKTTSLGFGAVYLFFNSAEVKAKNLLDSHLDLSFWTGTHKYLGSGNQYKGYLFYPTSNELDFRGFYRLRGTGITTGFKFWEEKFRFNMHLYQNTNFINPTSLDLPLNYFSFDSEIGFFLDNVNFQFFGGYTKDIKHPVKSAELVYGRGKVGFLFWIGNDNIEFFTSSGLSSLDNDTIEDMQGGTTNILDLLYLSAELKFKLYLTYSTISVMTMPSTYNEQSTGTDSTFAINYNLKVVPPNNPVNGGFDFNFTTTTGTGTADWHLYLAPYMAISISGVIWNLSLSYDFATISDARASGNNLQMLDGMNIIVGVSSRF